MKCHQCDRPAYWSFGDGAPPLCIHCADKLNHIQNTQFLKAAAMLSAHLLKETLAMRYLLDIAIAIAGIILGVLATNASAQSAKPQSYADCILDKARGLSKELAVVAKAACRDRFPAPS